MGFLVPLKMLKSSSFNELENILQKRPISPTERCKLKYISGNWRFIKCIFFKLFLFFILIALIYSMVNTRRMWGEMVKSGMKEFQVNFKNIKMTYWMDLPNERINPACKKATKMLILIMSRGSGFDRRQALRQTWLKDAVEGTTTKFLIADSIWDGSEKEMANIAIEQAMLEEEQKQFRDLIFIRGIEDNYANLHLKWLAGLHWQQAFCPQTEWIMKTDDDTIVHLSRLNHWIEQKFRSKLKQNEATYFGLMISGVEPIRDPNHKWFVPKSTYPNDHYPPYMQGATYVASRQAINAVLKFTNEVAGFNMDDVLFTGILAQKANVTLSDHQDIFWVGKKLREREECTDGIPNLCALWGAGSLKEFEQIYSDIKSIKCQN